MKKTLIIVLIILHCSPKGWAQLSLTGITRKYDTYQATWTRTKLQLLFNQEKFTAGDTVFFKAYFLKDDLTRIRGKQLFEAHLVDAKGQSRVHLKFHVHNGLGYNQFVIPGTIEPGTYYITAYNNWMRNFDPGYFYKKKITIVAEKKVISNAEPFLRVATEGGRLIAGVFTKLAVHTHRPHVSVLLKENGGQEVSRITTDSHSTASIYFTPEQGKRYIAQVIGEELQQELTITDGDGVGLQFTHEQNAIHATLILTSPANSLYLGKELYVVITSRGKIQYSAQMKHSQRDSLLVNTADFPEGVMKISLLDQTGTVLAFRDFYHHRDPVMVKVHSDQPVYTNREKVKLEISITDEEGKPLSGEFSVRAINKGLFETPAISFREELTLYSELKFPDFTYDNNEQGQPSLDNLLVIASEALPWRDILSNSIPTPPYAPSNVMEMKGKAMDGDTRQPLPDYTQILFYLQKDQTYYQTFTMNQGTVALTLQDFYGADEFFYLAKIRYGDEINNVEVIWENDPMALPAAPISTEKDSIDEYGSFAKRKQLIDQSFRVHSTLREAGSKSVSDDYDDLLEADIIVNLDDYVVFPTMRDVIKEVVPSMYARSTKKGDIVRVDLMPPLMGSSSPVYIIDGFATRNTEYFLSLKPSELKTLKVVNNPQKLVPTGLLGQFGLVIVESRLGNKREPLIIDNKRIKGIQLPVSLKISEEQKRNPDIPDFRSTLYWNPSIKTDDNGKALVEFTSSDDTGKVLIMVDGITNDLQPFSITAELMVEIKKSNP